MQPDRSLTHLLTIGSRDRLGMVMETLPAIQASGGALEALHLSRWGDASENQLKVTGLRPYQARLLCNRLAALLGVDRATIEHQITSPSPL